MDGRADTHCRNQQPEFRTKRTPEFELILPLEGRRETPWRSRGQGWHPLEVLASRGAVGPAIGMPELLEPRNLPRYGCKGFAGGPPPFPIVTEPDGRHPSGCLEMAPRRGGRPGSRGWIPTPPGHGGLRAHPYRSAQCTFLKQPSRASSWWGRRAGSWPPRPSLLPHPRHRLKATLSLCEPRGST